MSDQFMGGQDSAFPAPKPLRAEMIVYPTDRYTVPLPDGHRFPIEKYALLCERLRACPDLQFETASPLPADRLSPIHCPDYVDRVLQGTVTAREFRPVGLPWSAALVQRSLASLGSTLAASRTALAQGASASLAGGTHHAFRDRGEGFCVFNDVVVALTLLRAEGLLRRACIVDLDVHQGNGTASMLRDEPDFFTFSLHGQTNFPFRKEQSDLDIGLPDGTGDEEYLQALQAALPQVLDRPSDLVVYLAGADPYYDDRFGRLKLTQGGLLRRDRLVLQGCRQRGRAVVMVMAGGYARNIADTVAIQANSVLLLAGRDFATLQT